MGYPSTTHQLPGAHQALLGGIGYPQGFIERFQAIASFFRSFLGAIPGFVSLVMASQSTLGERRQVYRILRHGRDLLSCLAGRHYLPSQDRTRHH